MIRFIKNILDIKNILGLRRETPLDPLNPYEFMLHANFGNFSYTPTFTGDLFIFQTFSPYSENIDDSQSGIERTTTSDSSVVQVQLDGDVTELYLSAEQPVTHLYVSQNVTQLTVCDGLQFIDLRNAASLNTLIRQSTQDTVYIIYARADTEHLRDICLDLITNSTVTNYGILWVDSSQLYAQDVIAAARSKGWTINYL